MAARARIVWPVLAGAALVLAGCDDAPPKTVIATPGTTASWRIVVWGAGDERDPRIADATGRELLKRNLAATIVTGSGKADHVLQVTASPVVFPATESVRDGRDSRLLEQASFHTDAPIGEAQAVAAQDPTRALAISIALQISGNATLNPPPPPPPPAPPTH